MSLATNNPHYAVSGAEGFGAQQQSTRVRLLINAVAVLCIVTAPAWVYGLFFAGNYSYASALLLVPILLFFNLALAVHLGRSDPFLRRILPVAILVKTAAASLYLMSVFYLYSGGGDVILYFDAGRNYAKLLSTGHATLLVTPRGTESTAFVIMLTGVLISLIGDSLPTLVILFALLSFWGQYFCYRAYRLAFREQDPTAVGLLIFLLPSVVFWPATLGKDAWMAFFIGLSAYGYSKLAAKVSATGLLPLGLGLGGATLVRPHVAAMLGVAFMSSYLLGKRRQGVAGLLTQFLGLPLMSAGVWYVIVSAKQFLSVSDFKEGESALQRLSQTSNIGGSAFAASSNLFYRILTSPFIPFRPFPWEVSSAQAAVASVEGLLLLWLAWKWRRELLRTVLSWRSNPFLLFLFFYAAEFTIAFAAATTNFGILVRQRVMVLPFILMLLCLRSGSQRVSILTHVRREPGSPDRETRVMRSRR